MVLLRIVKLPNAKELGLATAKHAARALNAAIEKKGSARILLSTGASQFETINALLAEEIDWSKVEMFHLDEYVNLPESHPASFRKYLKERFTGKISLKKAHFVNGEGNTEETIKALNEEVEKAPIDVGLIGIGENAHIAFNDPPANFDTKDPFILVNLDDACKSQQVREGWFATNDDVPPQAITMSVHQILQTETIISAVPFASKEKAVKETLENDLTNEIPATALKGHDDMTLYLDEESAAGLDEETLKKYN